MKSLKKHPAADLPYNFDFRDWTLLTSTEKIVGTPTVTATPSGLTIGTPAVNSDGDIVSVRISGGTAGATYDLTCQGVTTSGYDVIGCGHLQVEIC